MLLSASLSGILLGLLTLVISGTLCILADRYINHQPGYQGALISSAAGNAVTTPIALVASILALGSIATVATAQIVTAVVVTAIGTPLLTSYIAKKFGCPRYDREALEKQSESEAIAPQ